MAIHNIPLEILCEILSYLDSSSVYPTLAYDYPEKYFTRDVRRRPEHVIQKPLKNASMVSRQWRAVCFPMIFRHIEWKFPTRDVFGCLDPKRQVSDLAGVLEELGEDLRTTVESITFMCQPWPMDIRDPPASIVDSVHGLWEMIFSFIEPTRITLFGDPCGMALLLGIAPIRFAESWMFDLSNQVLQLSRPSHTVSNASTVSLKREGERSVDIFSIRPWTEFLINEGSFLETYTTYEYHNNNPPCLLRDIFGSPVTQAVTTQRVRSRLPYLKSFSYVAIFPTGVHFTRTVLKHFPGAENVYFQIVPREFDLGKFLNKPEIMGHLDMKDPWMESNNVALALKSVLFEKGITNAAVWDGVKRFAVDSTYDRELFEVVSQGITEGFMGDLNYREWRVERTARGEVMYRDDREMP